MSYYEEEDYDDGVITEQLPNGYRVYNRYGKVIDEFIA